MACHIHQDEDTPRLALADWLEEHDDPRGECVRLQVRLAAMDANDPEYDRLFEQHQKWWKQYDGWWEEETGGWIWDAGPHDRGLPTVGYYDDENFMFGERDVAEDTPLIETGWPGMVWVCLDDPLDNAEGIEYDEDAHSEAIEAIAFEPFHRPPWASSSTPLGLYFPFETYVTPGHMKQTAKVPNLRGLSLLDTESGADLLSSIAKIKNLEYLDLGSVRLNDDGLRTLAPLKNLRTLIAPGATFTNKGAALLAKFKKLRELKLGTRRLSAAGFQAIAKLSKLEVLELEKANDAAVRHLAPLKRLRQLKLFGTNVTGRGVEQFPLLTDLSLESSQASDAGLANIATLARLRHLDVSGTNITGELFSRLSGLRWLETLYASETRVGDKALVHLEGLKNLENLSLSGTKVTKKGKAKLQNLI